MNQEINEILLSDLEETHFYFENIIDSLKEKNVPYSIEDIVAIEKNSYGISYDAIVKMNDSLIKYREIYFSNIEFFEGKSKLIFKYTLLYIVSILMIRIFSKSLSSEKINEIWYALVGLVLGSVNIGIINSNLNVYQYGNKENRELMNEINSLKEEYDTNFEIARREISYMISLNHNLEEIDFDEKKLNKIIKGMQQ